MSENISRLMDGEVDATELDAICGTLKRGEAMATWICYHAIGDALRGEIAVTRDVGAAVWRGLEAEPTVLAPQRALPLSPASWAWAVAATLAAVGVVGWTAYSLVDSAPAALARVGEAGMMRAAEVRQASVPTDLLFAHQEYAPSGMLQGASPYLRDVAVTREIKP